MKTTRFDPSSRFAALGYTAVDFRIHVFDLAEGLASTGLIGLSFLRQFATSSITRSVAISVAFPRRDGGVA